MFVLTLVTFIGAFPVPPVQIFLASLHKVLANFISSGCYFFCCQVFISRVCVYIKLCCLLFNFNIVREFALLSFLTHSHLEILANYLFIICSFIRGFHVRYTLKERCKKCILLCLLLFLCFHCKVFFHLSTFTTLAGKFQLSLTFPFLFMTVVWTPLMNLELS